MNKGDIVLQVNKHGKFEIDSEQFSGAQCGTRGKKEYNYEVMIEATDKSLSAPDMFMIENGIIKQYFDRTYVKEKAKCKSCEVMACDAIEFFRSLFIYDGCKVPRFPNVDVKRIVVLIRGHSSSFIKGEWVSKPSKLDEIDKYQLCTELFFVVLVASLIYFLVKIIYG